MWFQSVTNSCGTLSLGANIKQDHDLPVNVRSASIFVTWLLGRDVCGPGRAVPHMNVFCLVYSAGVLSPLWQLPSSLLGQLVLAEIMQVFPKICVSRG